MNKVKTIFRTIFVTSFFGWDNIKWFLKEIMNMYSSSTVSYFSKKRFESSIAFLSGVGAMLLYIYTHRHVLQNSEILADCGLLLGSSMWQVNKLQQEKKLNATTTPEPDNG